MNAALKKTLLGFQMRILIISYISLYYALQLYGTIITQIA